MSVKGNTVSTKNNFVYSDPNSHYFTSLNHILNFLKYMTNHTFSKEVEYLTKGLENTINKGYTLENKQLKKRKNKKSK